MVFRPTESALRTFTGEMTTINAVPDFLASKNALSRVSEIGKTKFSEPAYL